MKNSGISVTRWWCFCLFPLFILLVILTTGQMMARAAEKPCTEPDKGRSGSIVARFDGKFITLKDFESRMAAVGTQNKGSMKDLDRKRETLETLLRVYLFALAAKEEKLDQEEAVKKRIEDAADAILAAEYGRSITAEIGGVTEKEIDTYYREHEKEFTRPAMVRARHILIRLDPSAKSKEIAAARIKAMEIKKELETGADFAELAKKYSDDQGTKNRGGDLGYITEGRMGQAFFKAAFALAPGMMSDPVKTRQGFHIIKVDTRKEGQTLPLAMVSARIRSRIAAEKQNEATAKEYERLKAKYHVIILNENLKHARLKKGG